MIISFPFDSTIIKAELKDHFNKSIMAIKPLEIQLQVVPASNIFARYLILDVKKGLEEIRKIHLDKLRGTRMKSSKTIITILVVALIVQSAILMNNVIERQNSIGEAESAFIAGLNDVLSLFNRDINSKNLDDKIYFYSQAIAGIKVANSSLSQFNADQSMHTAIYLLSEYLKELDILGDDSRFDDLELYNLIIDIMLDIENIDSAERLTEYLNNADWVN